MAQQFGAEVLVSSDVEVGVGVGNEAGHRIDVNAEVGAGVFLRLQILHIDLPGHGLIAVFHRRVAFRHLYALHPIAWYVAELVGQGGAPVGGLRLGEELHVGATQAEELDLLGACGGVAVVHVDAGIGDEALAKVTASCLEQFVATDVK